MAIRQWSTTASGNASVAGINFAEGQAPSTVNNSARELMAQVRETYQPAEAQWLGHSGCASVASQTTFKIAGNQTTDFHSNRRLRLTGGSTTRYATIVSASFTTETTVTLSVDSGSLSASHSIVWLGMLSNTNDALPRGVVALLNATQTFTAQQHFAATVSFGADISVALGQVLANRLISTGDITASGNAKILSTFEVSATSSLGGVVKVGDSASFSASVHMAATLDVSATASFGGVVNMGDAFNIGFADVVVEHRETAGTDGGTSAASASYVARQLNTVVYDRLSIASLSASSFVVIPGGSYEAKWQAVFNSSGLAKTILQRYDTSATLGLGMSIDSSGSSNPTSDGFARFSLTATTGIGVGWRTVGGNASNGLGKATNLGTEVYVRLELRKVS